MKFRSLVVFLIVAALGVMSGCLSTSNSASSGSSLLLVATQGNTSVATFGIDLDNGTISATGSSASTGASPTAMALTPDGQTAFIANGAGSSQNGTVSAYSVGSDGSLKAAGTAQTVGSLPINLALDPTGHFLFVANQGTSALGSGTISVFSVQDANLTEVSGSPFVVPASTSSPAIAPGPSALAVTVDGKFLYVANRFNSTVYVFSIDSTGALTLVGIPATSGSNPAALTITPDGAFLYVANFGSNNISVFAICDKIATSCQTPGSPDGTLTQVPGSPFSSGIGPVALATSPSATYLTAGNPLAYLYVADQNSNQLSEYQISPVTGSLTPLSNATISTGPNPVSVVSRFGTTSGTTTTDYVYVSNQSGGTVSVFSFDTATGQLVQVESPVVTSSQPFALAVE